ncbi:MFS transporter [Donghicola tyrosinivorans]|uniref:Putative MFS family arabinose efflux permease n=1 Tax=Donghicola tyrosinivorans TaxID=1652492 RepID=A0A2T0WKK8_9RHOB|nr:MFS transporter [Donghicola tyrosinivorans]PRY87236.1 putative MFS family arabinose efflux permease [Donghicola tyrosinivorans]
MSLVQRIARAQAVQVLFRSQFGLYLAGNTLSLTGTWMQRIASSWLVWDWTGSAFWVGVLAASDLLPVVVISPFAGVAADRWDRLRLNVVAQVISILNAVTMALAMVTGHLGLWGVLALTLMQGVLTAATQPSRFAMVQQMVHRDQVASAVGLNSACVNIARLVGPAVAGAMILHWGIPQVFTVNAAVTVLFVVVLLRLRLEPIAKSPSAPFLAQMLEGFAYAARIPALRVILLAMFGGGAMVRAVMELMPVIAAQSFADAVTGLAMLTGSAAVGAVLAGLSVGQRAPVHLLRQAPMWWAIGAVTAIFLARATGPVMGILAAMALGATITRGLVCTQTFIQLTTPGTLRGRTLSVFGLFARGSPALGALAIGYGADVMGMQATVLLSSGLLFVVLAALALPLWRISEALDDGATPFD